MKLLALTALATLASALLAAQAKANYAPPTQYPLTSAAAQFRENTYRYHPCLARIIDMENGWWDPTVDYGDGHSNVNKEYDMTKTYTGTKMSSAGKFGSECGAWYSRSQGGNY